MFVQKGRSEYTETGQTACMGVNIKYEIYDPTKSKPRRDNNLKTVYKIKKIKNR